MRSYYKGVARDQYGAIIGGATIAIYLAGTTTVASVYTVSTGGTAVNSVTADIEGVFYFYVDTSDYSNIQLFKLVISYLGNTATYDNIVAFYNDNYYIDALGEYGSGTAYTQSTIEAALTAIGTTNKATMLLRPGTWAVTADLTIPANVTLKTPAGAVLSIATGKTLTINGPFEAGLYQVFDCVGTGVVTGLKYASPQMFGAKADGATDDAAAISKAIAAASSGELHFYGSYASSGSSGTLTGGSKWIVDGSADIKYIGATNDSSILWIELDGYDLSVEGHFSLDGDNKVLQGLSIYNTPATMAGAATLLVDGVKVKNIYSDTNGKGASGLLVYGAYNLVRLDGITVTNVSRAATVGIPGLQGCAGIASTGDITIYPLKTVISTSYIDTVTSEDTPGTADYVDMDGVNVQSGGNAGATFIINSTTFRNCPGRSIKSQVSYNTVEDIIIISDEDSRPHITNYIAIDLQVGGGSIKNIRATYDSLTGGVSPFSTTSGTLLGPGRAGDVTTISNVVLTNNVDSGLGELRYLVLSSTTTAGGTLDISNVSCLGVGNVYIFLYGDLSKWSVITVNNNSVNNITGFLYSTAACPDTTINASGNRMSGTAKALYRGVGAYPTIYGSKNYNFLEGNIISFQADPIARTTSTTFQEYMLQGFYGGIITITHTAGATQEYTLPTGTNMDTYFPGGINKACDWYLINLSVAGTDTATLKENTGHTIVGNPVVLNQSSGHFLTRKTAANTFVTYRVG